jgi:hypothetical protein
LSVSVTIGRPGQFAEFECAFTAAAERAALRSSAKVARDATAAVRAEMRGAGLGRLANAIGGGSDLAKHGIVHRREQGFSASGWVYVRGHSERTLGALTSAVEGATIVPRRGKWLAIPGRDIPQRYQRKRMTPELYRQAGLEQTIGPLEFVPSRRRGEALLVVRGPLSVDRFGRKGRHARRVTGRRTLSGSRRAASFIVAFVLIRATSRQPRVDPTTIIAAHAARLPEVFAGELAKEV